MSQDPSARRAATMVDVAAAAGISRGTVSRYVNGRGYVSPHARQKIEQAVAEVGFVPNVAARRLAGAAARHIALVVHEDVARFAQDANLGAMMVGANRRLNQLDYQLVVLIAGDQPAIERLQQTIRGGLIDAAMLASARLNDPIFGLLQAAGLPVAVVGRHPELPAAAAVDVDNRGGAREIVTRLLATGRRQVGLIAGPADAQSALDREEGFRDATGTAYHPNWVVRAPDWSYEAGLAAAAELFNRCPTLDGVFGANDAFAAAAVTLAQEQGRNVPDDIGVVGFDNSRWATWTRPHLSTVAQPTETLGERMADLVVRQLAGEDLRGALITEPTRLVWRGSA